MKTRLLVVIFAVLLFPSLSLAQGRFLFGASSSNNLIKRNLSSGSEAVVGLISIPNVQGLAHDTVTGTTYCITSDGILCTIDLDSGQATAIQTITGGPFDFYGIAIDRSVSPPKMYLMNLISPHTFYHIDISGSPPFNPIAVGSSGGTSIYGISLDANSNSLYAVDSSNSFLILNKTNGSIDTPIGPTGQTNLRGLAFDFVTDTFFGTTSGGQLLSFSGGGTATVVDSTQMVSHLTFVENIPATPTPTVTPTSTATVTATPGIVKPGIVPLAPEVTLDSTRPKPAAVIILQDFTGASKNKLPAMLGISAARKIDFRYSVEIKSTTDADGNPIKRSQRDIRNLITKRNELTIKNLKANSNYNVKYKVEITSKAPGVPAKVVGKTKFSPTESFTTN